MMKFIKNLRTGLAEPPTVISNLADNATNGSGAHALVEGQIDISHKIILYLENSIV